MRGFRQANVVLVGLARLQYAITQGIVNAMPDSEEGYVNYFEVLGVAVDATPG